MENKNVLGWNDLVSTPLGTGLIVKVQAPESSDPKSVCFVKHMDHKTEEGDTFPINIENLSKVEDTFIQIDEARYEGMIPNNYDLVVADKDRVEESAMVLMGFDEVGVYESGINNPVYGFLKAA